MEEEAASNQQGKQMPKKQDYEVIVQVKHVDHLTPEQEEAGKYIYDRLINPVIERLLKEQEEEQIAGERKQEVKTSSTES